ncbi:MAG TPA: hypothetical protein VNA57_03705, partial [Acidimicrobiales bacterium]|nr:hypothetical protein [Acidimicrobiales bacterium]
MSIVLVPLVLALIALVGNSPAAQSAPTSTCRASAVRFEGAGLLQGVLVEPIVASPEDECTADVEGILDDTFGGPLAGRTLELPGGLGTVRALYAETQADGTSEAGVLRTTLTIDPLPPIVVDALMAQSEAACDGDDPVFDGESRIARVDLNADDEVDPVVDIRTEQTLINNLAGVTVIANQQTVTDDTIVQRALFVETPVGTLVVAEAISDIHGCGDDTDTDTDVDDDVDVDTDT